MTEPTSIPQVLRLHERVPYEASQPSEHDALAPVWEYFWSTRDHERANQLLIDYEPLVRRVTTRLPKAVRDYWSDEDLASFGFFGLLDSVERFDETSDPVHFPRYAVQRIRGAIFDELRRLDWLPRSVRRQVIDYRDALDALGGELGREPTNEDVTKFLGLDATRGESLLRGAQLLSLSHESNETASHELLGQRDHPNDPESSLLAREEIDAMFQAIGTLPPQQREVVTLRFLSEMSQKQIAELLGISRSRVCQVEAAAIRSLQRRLEPGERDSDDLDDSASASSA